MHAAALRLRCLGIRISCGPDLTLLPELYTICDLSFQSGEDAHTFFHHRRADLNRFDPAAQYTECLDPTGNTSYTDDVEPSSGGAKNHLGL